MGSWSAGWRHPEFRRGARGMAEIAPGIAAWGLVAGVTMVKSGLGVPLALAMSLLVFSGTAQLAVLPLIAGDAPIWVVWATAICVNLRFVIFSASWRPYFGAYPFWLKARLSYFTADLNYVAFMRRFPRAEPAPEQLPYFWGGVATNWFSWQVPSVIGILLGDVIPTQWGLGFAGTVALIGLMCSLLVDRAAVAATGIAACAALAAYALPLKLNIVVAIAVAVAIGLLIDHTTARPAEPLVEDET
jgi:predicted branched-subunit amino acid permease